MENNQLKTYIEAFKKTNDNDYLLKIINKMMPLIKKFANKLGNMEKDDALQEFVVTLIECTLSITDYTSEAKCLSYYQRSIINRYKRLKNSMSTLKEHEIHTDELPNLEICTMDYSNDEVLLENLLSGYPKLNERKKTILLLLYKGYGCTEIAKYMKLSRQYVTRLRNELKNEFATQFFYKQ